MQIELWLLIRLKIYSPQTEQSTVSWVPIGAKINRPTFTTTGVLKTSQTNLVSGGLSSGRQSRCWCPLLLGAHLRQPGGSKKQQECHFFLPPQKMSHSSSTCSFLPSQRPGLSRRVCEKLRAADADVSNGTGARRFDGVALNHVFAHEPQWWRPPLVTCWRSPMGNKWVASQQVAGTNRRVSNKFSWWPLEWQKQQQLTTC